MKYVIKNGMSEFSFFGDLFKFRQDYYNPKTGEEYESVKNRINKILEKYKNEEFYEFVKGTMLAHLNDLEKRRKIK